MIGGLPTRLATQGSLIGVTEHTAAGSPAGSTSCGRRLRRTAGCGVPGRRPARRSLHSGYSLSWCVVRGDWKDPTGLWFTNTEMQPDLKDVVIVLSNTDQDARPRMRSGQTGNVKGLVASMTDDGTATPPARRASSRCSAGAFYTLGHSRESGHTQHQEQVGQDGADEAGGHDVVQAPV